MMATAGSPSTSSFLPLLESVEDNAAAQPDQIDAYLTIANRLSGEEGRLFLPAVEKHFFRLGKAILAHITSQNAELSQAALQTLGFCVYHSHVISGVPEIFATEILSALCSLVVKSADKNTCTRALWVISKQSFPADLVAKKIPSILMTLDSVWKREDVQSVVMEHEALNVVIRMLEQVPSQMGDAAVQWAKLVIPLVVHSASKVRLRAAAAMEMGMPLLLEKQAEVAAIIEPMMSSKLIPELQKLFKSKNETNVLKLWPLFVKLLGKLLHRGGPFINSLLHLEELGFRSSSPTIKKIAFIAWKSLIDNFALNPDILCSGKRMKLLMQPLISIQVRTEALLLTKVEVWWYLVVQLGPNLSSNFDQVSAPLLQSTICSDTSSVLSTPSRAVTQNGSVAPSTPKTGNGGHSGFNSPAAAPRMNLNSSVQATPTFSSVQLIGLEMLLHYFLGPEVVATAAKNKLTLSLEPLNHPLLSGASSFTKHAAVLISNIRDSFTNIGKEAPDSLLAVIWKSLVRFVNLTIESVGNKKDRQGCEVLTLMLQALQSIVTSEHLPADKVLILFEATVKGIPQRVLGSASYQVGKMDVLNGTPALFLILLLFDSSMLPAYIEDERFFHCLQTLVGCGLSGPTSPLAFAEAVLGAISRSSASVQNKEQLWKMWSVMVGPFTDTITQSNEVNQGDALEHNFSAVHSALMVPITHLLHGTPLPQAAQKSMLSSWSKLYKVFARCSALVVTAEENICCEELCAKIAAAIDKEALKLPSTLNAVASILQVMVECVDFSPYTPHFQQKLKSPHTPVNWMKKKNKVLGNLSTFQSLLVQSLELYLEAPEASSEATGLALISIISALFTNLVLANAVQESLTSLISPLTLFYKQASSEPSVFTSQLIGKLEKLLSDILSCLQTRSTLPYNDELLTLLSPLLCELFPHKNKQLRTSVTHFWNSTFANAVSLTYSDQIRPILSQVKQRTPIILPGFEAVSVSDELSGQYSSESSQLETKLSGMPVSSVGKRDSLLGKAAELKENSATKTSKPVSTKLDFGSPKPPRREVLEEEASIDFVFIPPETKDRVLTEHQKEVKRTKRVDIPAMYNNLDASLDTTVFTQYTQSQEDSLDKQPTGQADSITKEAPAEVPQQDVENEEDAEVLIKATQDFTSPTHTENVTEAHQHEEIIPESTDVSMEDDVKSGRAQEVQSTEDISPNLSVSSDVVSGTPQKTNSRRQTFITLEKYVDGKPASPSSVSFTGPLIKNSNSQERSKKTPSSQASQTPTAPNSQDSQMRKTSSQSSANNAPESPRRPKDTMHTEPVRLTERLPSDSTEEEDIIPDTQVEAEYTISTNMASTLEEIETSSQEDQTSPSQSFAKEPRRSGRSRVRPLLPGEDPVELDGKHTLNKRKHSGDDLNTDTEKSQKGRPNTRSKQAAEDGRRLRTRARSESSQNDSQSRTRKKIQLFSNSQDFLDKPERKKRRSNQLESSQTDLQSDTQSDYESQSQQRINRSRKSWPDTSESRQTFTHDSEPKEDSQTNAVSFPAGVGSQELEKTEKDGDETKNDSPIITSSPKKDGLSQESVRSTEEEDAQLVTSPAKDDSQDLKCEMNQLNQEQKIEEAVDDILSQGESQTITPSDGRSKRRSRRSKALPEVAESENKGENSESSGRQTRSFSQATSSAEARAGGRTRRSKVPSSTPDNSQDLSGSESSQGRARRSRSSPALAANVESPEFESSETLLSKKKGRKSRVSLQSPLPLESKRAGDNMEEADASQQAETQIVEATGQSLTESEESSKTPDLPQVTVTEQIENQESLVETEADAQTKTDSENISMSPCKEEQKDSNQTESNSHTSVQDVELPESVGISDERCVDSPSLHSDAAENLPVAETETVNAVPEKQNVDEDGEQPAVPEDTGAESQESHIVSDEPPKDEEEHTASHQPAEEHAEQQVPSLQDDQTQITEGEEPCNEDAPISKLTSGPVSQDSPVKQKDLESVMAPDVGQSPSSSKTRGTWSPSASPSTSILKKAQKRSLEVETPSPLVKSRRVSFANPIQQQETADDIDRRSPAIRTSSPRRSKASSIPQPKHITTPTKGFLVLSPRNLHSPTYRSSKKCLISEMTQEPQAVSKDCIYPALVGCSTPVEAVLPHISSNMWSRGFGQLVRARNIKTVGDLSALTPTEIKTLPIRSPKISNVKKALKTYEQQRKGRGVDELRSFDETEMMTSELEENAAPQTMDDEDKAAAEPLATELVDEPVSADGSPEPDASADQSPDLSERRPEGSADNLLAQVESLTGSMTPLELRRCSPQQLVQMHDQLGGLMRCVVVELQTRLSQTEGKL